MRTLWLLGLLGSLALAAPVDSGDGLQAEANGVTVQQVRVGAQALPLTVTAELRPALGRPLHQAALSGAWSGGGQRLRLDATVTAADESLADLVIRAAPAKLPLGTFPADPLLLPRKLLSRLPVVSLRVGEQDLLSLAVPVDRLTAAEFRETAGGVEVVFRLGFTKLARPALQQRAELAVELARTDPVWHYRSALDGYYRRHAAAFTPFERRGGGWFFAAAPEELPNPQHFRFYEGGPWGADTATAAGLGTYPYRESSSATVSLTGQPPKTYDEARARFEELARAQVPRRWQPQLSLVLDATTRHGGTRSLRGDSPDGSWVGALQEVTLAAPTAEPLEVSGWSRADGVAGELSNDYPVYVDVVYADGGYLFGQCAMFRGGTHDWEQARHRIEPTRAVAKLRIFALLRNRPGKVWFDDLRVGPLARPEVNWVDNGGFEEIAPAAATQYIRDNVCHVGEGRWAFHITDNLSADVGPATPMNLVRFSLNVDPDLPSTPDHPAVAATEFETYDNLFQAHPELAGCYIDSVSAWCAGLAITRREQWPAADVPFTYDGEGRVATLGRYAMADFLRRLQQRYHPQGRGVFTNIHCELLSFPLYLVSDVPGIESSNFEDPEQVFFYRAASWQKPLLMMNFVNLHRLSEPGMAETFHQRAAQFGCWPSTGRQVETAYRMYGEVTHRWLPAIAELHAAGWQPVPLATGAWTERFGDGQQAWFTVAAGGEQALRVDATALRSAGPVEAWDAVALRRLALRAVEGAWEVSLPASRDLRVVRLLPAGSAPAWLRQRALTHLENIARLRRQAVGWRPPADPAALVARRLSELATADGLPDLCERRELLGARAALQAAE
ncbi:MAG: hypothetical protein IT204_25070 [Fimbriimonadaceae bacterium]|nr:hypothetical protein [Fimbriimonadaceae bacterium]